MKNEKGISLIVLLVIIILTVFVLFLVFGGNSKNNTNTKNQFYGLGDTITFEGLELTFDSTYSFDVVASTLNTDYNGDYIKLGASIKNVSAEKNYLNPISYNFYGSKGTTLTKIGGYFDDDVDCVNSLKPNASYKGYFYIPYDGNGNYSIDFNDYPQTISVEFQVIK